MSQTGNHSNLDTLSSNESRYAVYNALTPEQLTGNKSSDLSSAKPMPHLKYPRSGYSNHPSGSGVPPHKAHLPQLPPEEYARLPPPLPSPFGGHYSGGRIGDTTLDYSLSPGDEQAFHAVHRL